MCWLNYIIIFYQKKTFAQSISNWWYRSVAESDRTLNKTAKKRLSFCRRWNHSTLTNDSRILIYSCSAIIIVNFDSDTRRNTEHTHFQWKRTSHRLNGCWSIKWHSEWIMNWFNNFDFTVPKMHFFFFTWKNNPKPFQAWEIYLRINSPVCQFGCRFNARINVHFQIHSTRC